MMERKEDSADDQVTTSKAVTFDPSITSLPSIVAPAARSCWRCKAKLENDWKFCGTCGQKIQLKKKKDGSLPQKQPQYAIHAVQAAQTPTSKSSGEQDQTQTELKHLPSSIISGLNTVLKGFQAGIFNEPTHEVKRKELLVAALELESALQIEDVYTKLQNDQKLTPIPGMTFDDPRPSNLPRGVQPAPSPRNYGFVYGSSLAAQPLPPIAAQGMSAIKFDKGEKGSGIKRKKRTNKNSSLQSIHPAAECTSYLDEVGSVATYYQMMVARDKELAGLRRVIVEEEENARIEVDMVKHTESGEIESGIRNPYDRNHTENDIESDEVQSSGVMYWGELRQKGRFFLPRDGDVGQQVEEGGRGGGRMKSRRLSDSSDKSETSDNAPQADTPQTPNLTWQQVLQEAEHLTAMQTPLLWTTVIRPQAMVGTGLQGYIDDRPLSRPLTPEPTSDDEDDKFEAQLLAMEAERVKAARTEVPSGQAAAMADTLSNVVNGLTDSSTDAKSTLETAPTAEPGEDEDIHEMDHINPQAAEERALQQRAEKKARLARARRQLAFNAAFQTAQEQGKPVPKKYKPKKKRPDEMAEDELRAYELQRALLANDGMEEEDDDDDSTLTPDPIPIQPALPSFKAYSVISRMYRASCKLLEGAIAQAQFRAIDEVLPRPRTGTLPFAKFGKMLAVVHEALLQAPGVDMQAKIEFQAFTVSLNKARADAANAVADALEDITSYHAQYSDMQESLKQNKTQPRIAEKLAKIEATASAALFEKGQTLQSLQASETTVTMKLQEEEFIAIETVKKWRPLHATWIGKARWAKKCLEGVLFTSAAKVIQRTAKKKLLMLFWGEPAEKWSDRLVVAAKERAKKKVVYKERPW